MLRRSPPFLPFSATAGFESGWTNTVPDKPAFGMYGLQRLLCALLYEANYTSRRNLAWPTSTFGGAML